MGNESSLEPSLTSSPKTTEWVLLLVQLPGVPAKPAGVLLLDRTDDLLYAELTGNVSDDEDITEIWRDLREEFAERAKEGGGCAFLNSLEDRLSNFLQIDGPRRELLTADPAGAVAALFRCYVSHDEPAL